MISLEVAIGKRAVDEALEALRLDPQQAKAPTKAGVSMLMLSLYYELPEVAHAIRKHLESVTYFEAAAMGELEAVRPAVDSDPKLVDAYSPDGFTVLGLAIFFRQPEVARYLIEAGADVNLPSTNAQKVAPIHAACARQDYDTLRLLLAKGADPDQEQQDGFTPLRQAIATGNQTLEEILRSAGAKAA